MFGRMYNRNVAYVSILLFVIGFNVTYMPLMFAGVAGMPRRYADYLPEFETYHAISTTGSWILYAGILLMVGNLGYSVFKGKKTDKENPWGGKTLEWRTPTPPPTLNFDGEPDTSIGPYDYPVEVER